MATEKLFAELSNDPKIMVELIAAPGVRSQLKIRIDSPRESLRRSSITWIENYAEFSCYPPMPLDFSKLPRHQDLVIFLQSRLEITSLHYADYRRGLLWISTRPFIEATLDSEFVFDSGPALVRCAEFLLEAARAALIGQLQTKLVTEQPSYD